ncbi:MAG: pyrroline-5-carboxylate reductase [Corynebacterium sp.]|nr:pyrroline-5-carboxylate reductase [Corynebacterium sp.]
MIDSTISIIGGGNIGEALVAGLLAAGADGDRLTVVERRPERADYLTDTYGIRVTAELSTAADVTFIAVKPKDVVGCATQLQVPEGAVVVSLAAGVTVATVEAALPNVAVVRVMPNTPMLVRQGMAAVCPGSLATDAHVQVVRDLLDTVGETIVLPESHIDEVTALSGSSPAYVFLFAEALIDAGVARGLTRDEATTLVVNSVAGAGALMRESPASVQELRAQVTSPGGTTAAALKVLEAAGFRSALADAVDACAEKNAELS